MVLSHFFHYSSWAFSDYWYDSDFGFTPRHVDIRRLWILFKSSLLTGLLWQRQWGKGCHLAAARQGRVCVITTAEHMWECWLPTVLRGVCRTGRAGRPYCFSPTLWAWPQWQSWICTKPLLSPRQEARGTPLYCWCLRPLTPQQRGLAASWRSENSSSPLGFLGHHSGQGAGRYASWLPGGDTRLSSHWPLLTGWGGIGPLYLPHPVWLD